MIGKLTGLIDSIGEDTLILDVNGVGYRVHAPARMLSRLKAGAQVRLVIETYIREEEIRLYGFESETEREWFKILQSVQGVGARVALALLSVLTPAELARAAVFGDKAMFGRAAGVGPKLAQRLASELKDKVPQGPVADGPARVATQTDSTMNDALSALMNLGYAQSDAARALMNVAERPETHGDVAALIRAGLKELGR